jgi:hypothetical protein
LPRIPIAPVTPQPEAEAEDPKLTANDANHTKILNAEIQGAQRYAKVLKRILPIHTQGSCGGTIDGTPFPFWRVRN